MPSEYGEIIADFKRLDFLQSIDDDIVDEAVRLLAAEGLSRADLLLTQLVYTRSPNDKRLEPTGALRASGYIRTSRDDFASQAEGRSFAKNRNVTFGAVPPAPSKGQAQILYAVEHAVYVHEGTRYVTGRPFLRGPVETLAPMWAPVVSQLMKERGF